MAVFGRLPLALALRMAVQGRNGLSRAAVFDATSSPNLALNKPSLALSFEDTSACPLCTSDKAFDGNSSTRWGSALRSDPQWIQVDLGAGTTFDLVVLHWEAACGKKYEIQTSDDAAAWTTVFAETAGTGGTDDIPLSPAVTARYVRMYGTKRCSNRFGYSLFEFDVYYANAPTPSPLPTDSSRPSETPTSSHAPSESGSPTVSSGCPPTPSPDLIYKDPTKSTRARVVDLLCRMTTEEKIGQMTQVERKSLNNDQDIANFHLGSLLSGGGSTPSSNNPAAWADMIDGYQTIATSTRLEIPLIYGVDAVHGHNNVVGATLFPHNIGLGAARNATLMEEIGYITAKEVYATGIHWNFSPCLCVCRDERWGRCYECFGETPEVVAEMTTYIDGLQGAGLGNPNAILATAKHWVADGGTTNGEDQGKTEMTEADLRAIHIPPYFDAIDRNVGSMMPSYSSVRWTDVPGAPEIKMHAHQYLIEDVLRGEMNFDGFIISDWQAIDQIPGDYASDVRISINAGIDMVMVPHNYQLFKDTLQGEIDAGNIDMARIDEAVARILTAKFELGLFERTLADRTDIADVGSAAHRAVARQAVRESLVLLQNNNNALPIDLTSINKIVIAGKSRNDIGNQCGGWSISWQGSSGDITPGTTVLNAVQREAAVHNVEVQDKGDRATGKMSGDFGIVVVGERPYAEGQGDDSSLDLDSADKQAISNVCGAMPCVVILISGRPMIVTDQLLEADAFISAWLPGTEGGDGIADLLFSDGTYDFTGRLPITWMQTMDQVPINSGDATYQPLFEYGFGCDYAQGCP